MRQAARSYFSVHEIFYDKIYTCMAFIGMRLTFKQRYGLPTSAIPFAFLSRTYAYALALS